MNHMTKTNSLLLHALLLCTSFNTISALSLHDLEKRPSLKIEGIKILANGTKIIVGIGDIEKIEQVDAIVNAANADLRFGSGIAGSIATALGLDGVAQTYREIKAKYATPVAVGSASITKIPEHTALKKTGFNHLIHAVAPDCRNPWQQAQWQELLRTACTNILKTAKENNISSVIVPSLGTGIFACPQDEAHGIIAQTLVQALKTDKQLSSLQEIIFVIWPHQPHAQTIAQEWLASIDEAIHKDDASHQTLVGTFPLNS